MESKRYVLGGRMTQSLEALTRQMDSMESIHSVVHTMKTLSVINAAPYEQAARAIEAYHETVLEGLHAFLSSTGPVTFERSATGTRVVIALGTDHGLCGSYNEVIADCLRAHMEAQAGEKTTILCVGAQMADALKERGLDIHELFFPAASVDGIGRLANLLTQHLDAAQTGPSGQDIAVDLAYLARAAAGGQAPQLVQLLPLDPEFLQDLQAKPWQSRSLPTFSMPSGDLFKALVRAHIFASLVRAATEAMVTENAARLALMQQAEQSVEDRLEAFKSEANALRQSGITTELLDVIIGFEALNKDEQRGKLRSLKRTNPSDQHPKQRKLP